MTWIIFDNVNVWKLIHMYSFLLFPWLAKKLSQLSNLELNSLFSGFYGSVQTKKSMNWVYKTNIDFSFIRGMIENYCTLGKIQPWPTIHLGPNRPRVNSRPRLNFTSGTIIYPHSPHEQSIFVWYDNFLKVFHLFTLIVKFADETHWAELTQTHGTQIELCKTDLSVSSINFGGKNYQKPTI